MAKSDAWIWQVDQAVTEIDDGLWLIDVGFQGRAQVVAAYLLAGDDELALIETGPASTLTNLRAAVAHLGFDIDRLGGGVVTHIHLDHAGASGMLAAANPDFRLYVHPRGAPHMSDPGKLIASATRIYGDQMDELWGEMRPIPEHQIIPLDDHQTLRLAGRDLQIVFTPGHASHHLAILDRATNGIFTGDVGAVRMPGQDYICPPTPPPDLDRDLWVESISRLQAMQPERLYLTHFGVVSDASKHLERIIPAVDQFIQIGERALAEGADQETMTAAIQAQVRADLDSGDPEVLANYESATPSYMAAMGLTRYLTKRAERAAQ
jgi:glyoxylase-like metal-dependent hydrolase (beta-lactamase superfamily II)